jgi:methylglyoxal synthase
MARRLRMALVAHDARKEALIGWARRWEGWLAEHDLCGTGTTSGEIERACPRLRVEALLSGPKGGDMQIGARIAEGRLDAMVFLPDPAATHPHEADFQALIRMALLADIPLALNAAGAEHLARGLSQEGP